MHRMLHMHSVDKSDDGCVQNPSKKVLALGFVHGERGKKKEDILYTPRIGNQYLKKIYLKT